MLKVAKRDRRGMQAMLGCRGAARFHAPTQLDVPTLAWSVCPLDVLEAPQFRVLGGLAAAARISPLAHWPLAYPPWIVEGLQLLRQED